MTPPDSPEAADEAVQEEGIDTEIARTTRSGKAFGVWQSRRRKLRQEAMDDPDMEVEDEEENEEESDEEEEKSFEDSEC
jgi:hypothetical protein